MILKNTDKGNLCVCFHAALFLKIMESLEHALKRSAPILAEYLGGAVTCDAHHITNPQIDGLGVSSCIEKSLESAGVSPEEVLEGRRH
jgi:3-oxoacyl-(acyl-carrier-protein) synthase